MNSGFTFQEKKLDYRFQSLAGLQILQSKICWILYFTQAKICFVTLDSTGKSLPGNGIRFTLNSLKWCYLTHNGFQDKFTEKNVQLLLIRFWFKLSPSNNRMKLPCNLIVTHEATLRSLEAVISAWWDGEICGHLYFNGTGERRKHSPKVIENPQSSTAGRTMFWSELH